MSENSGVDAYTHTLGIPDVTESAILPLYDDALLNAAVIDLRQRLAADAHTDLTNPFIENFRRYHGHWFQRIDFPAHGLASTSDHSLAYIDEGGLNTLNQRLTSEEASILRPWPKWTYIEPILPDMTGKTVLELGSSNGFFSFRFAERGAQAVTGVEILKEQCDAAKWAADVLDYNNVTFLNADLLLDLTIQKHDIVFLSEVHNHFLVPFFGLLRILNLARELVIFDASGIIPSDEQGLQLYTGTSQSSGNLIYTHVNMTDRLMLDFLGAMGIERGRITRYRAPNGAYHTLFVINTRGRNIERHPEYLKRFMNLAFHHA
jgi:2-polyprenyl-3-methyl-5-hydroxy-6-metoxy-1,4-benzoquinol methylase